MAQRGRPRKNGKREGWAFHRAAVALCAYDQARLDGEKYSAALQAGVAAVRQEFPGMPMSETEMKRILVEFRSKGSASVLLVDENPDAVTLGSKDKRVWDLRFGAPPNYPRHNARD
jgi:hypothetical protein